MDYLFLSTLYFCHISSTDCLACPRNEASDVMSEKCSNCSTAVAGTKCTAVVTNNYTITGGASGQKLTSSNPEFEGHYKYPNIFKPSHPSMHVLPLPWRRIGNYINFKGCTHWKISYIIIKVVTRNKRALKFCENGSDSITLVVYFHLESIILIHSKLKIKF